MAQLISTNPSKNYEAIGEVEISSDSEIKEKVALANQVKRVWKEFGVQKRIELLKPIYEEFKMRQAEIAELITREMGKPITESISEASSFISEFEWFMNHVGPAVADEVTHEDDKSLHKIVYEPFGTAAVISPWNYPFGMAMWGIIPNLLVGNTVVFKISEECPLVGKLIEQVMLSHDLPAGVFAEVYGAGEVGQKLAESEINLIWFTGSTRVGKLLYKIAADKFIKAILEMGGSSPCLVFEDVDVPRFVQAIYPERFSNCGQVCDSIKRLIVHESIFDQVVKGLQELVEAKIVGDPTNIGTHLGCLVAKRQLTLLQEQVGDALQKGAKAVAGGGMPDDLAGAFYKPTILTNITRDMRVWKEEVFGPVLPVVSFKTEAEAVEMANDTSYGLGSRIWSKDLERAKRVASRIEAGTVEINQVSRWLSCNPFGGYKQSGMGREHGTVGFRELCQIKLISMEK
ncbi:MAG: aldehyde dehydrogenase family protein [Patescibacteria group bacterium]|jgi:succinate-semialdehyde dehydrogenase/glutarate-semialdehyde dehydrogenase